MRQLLTPVIAGVFFCAADNGKGNFIATIRTKLLRAAPRLLRHVLRAFGDD